MEHVFVPLYFNGKFTGIISSNSGKMIRIVFMKLQHRAMKLAFKVRFYLDAIRIRAPLVNISTPNKEQQWNPFQKFHIKKTREPGFLSGCLDFSVMGYFYTAAES